MVKILRNCDPMADCKPVVFMSCFLLIFWLLLSYVTNSYFAIFLMVSNFILIFGCCVSLSGYVVGQLIDTRRDTGQLIEVTTISAPQPYVRPPEYPPSYDEAIRCGWQHCMNQNGGDGVVLCIPLENETRINPIYMNLPCGTPVEAPHIPVPYNGMPSIPSYEMSTSSVVNNRSSLPLTVTPRSNIVNDLESSATVMEPYPTIHTMTPLSHSTITNTVLESSTVIPVAPSASRALTPPSRLTGESVESSFNVEIAQTSTAISGWQSAPQISRFRVSSESTELCSSTDESVEQLEQFSKTASQVQHKKDWEMCVELPTSSQNLEFRRFSSSLPSRHPSSLRRSVSFPGIR